MGDRERLTRLLGVWGSDTEYRVVPTLPDVPKDEPDLQNLERVAIEHRLDLSAAREEIRLASAALQVTKGSRAISGLNVGAHAHRDPDGPTTVGTAVDFELPIFDQKQAEVARLRAELGAAQHRADALAIAIRTRAYKVG